MNVHGGIQTVLSHLRNKGGLRRKGKERKLIEMIFGQYGQQTNILSLSLDIVN